MERLEEDEGECHWLVIKMTKMHPPPFHLPSPFPKSRESAGAEELFSSSIHYSSLPDSLIPHVCMITVHGTEVADRFAPFLLGLSLLSVLF